MKTSKPDLCVCSPQSSPCKPAFFPWSNWSGVDFSGITTISHVALHLVRIGKVPSVETICHFICILHFHLASLISLLDFSRATNSRCRWRYERHMSGVDFLAFGAEVYPVKESDKVLPKSSNTAEMSCIRP